MATTTTNNKRRRHDKIQLYLEYKDGVIAYVSEVLEELKRKGAKLDVAQQATLLTQRLFNNWPHEFELMSQSRQLVRENLKIMGNLSVDLQDALEGEYTVELNKYYDLAEMFDATLANQQRTQAYYDELQVQLKETIAQKGTSEFDSSMYDALHLESIRAAQYIGKSKQELKVYLEEIEKIRARLQTMEADVIRVYFKGNHKEGQKALAKVRDPINQLRQAQRASLQSQ